jgi:predicted nucleotidyltransferase/HEPN domain-containing protein
MKTSLDHLPLGKQRELAHVVQVIRDGFTFAIARRTQPRLRNGKLLKIILFGSYARGDWVSDPVGRYYSDYDLLVVVSDDELTDVPEFWEKTEARLIEEWSAGQSLRTPVEPLYHSIDYVNEQLALGKYFFADIFRDGIVLFEEPGNPLIEPQPLNAQQAAQEMVNYFDEWFESAARFLQNARDNTARGWTKEAAFLSHQATERFYHCLILIRTLYSHKTHNLNKLREKAEELEPHLKEVWPKTKKFERRGYELLREAYIKARYSKHYLITIEELNWIHGRVEILKSMIETVYSQRVAELAKTD